MKKLVYLILTTLMLTSYNKANAQDQTDTVANSYFVTYSKAEYLQKLAALPCGIKETDALPTILKKIKTFLIAFKPDKKYPNDGYAKLSALQALKSVAEGGYGIGAILIDSKGTILVSAHNSQIQLQRSDLHGEMTLLTQFEKTLAAKKYLNSFVYKPGLTVFSSAEPCPMCFMRLAIAGVKTLYCTPGPDDGMANRVNCLPPAWVGLAAKNPIQKANCSPVMQKLAHLLFFSFLMDNRGPKG